MIVRAASEQKESETMTTFDREHVIKFYSLYTSERREIAEWLGLLRDGPNESDVEFGKRILLGAKFSGKLGEVAERIDKYHADRSHS